MTELEARQKGWKIEWKSILSDVLHIVNYMVIGLVVLTVVTDCLDLIWANPSYSELRGKAYAVLCLALVLPIATFMLGYRLAEDKERI